MSASVVIMLAVLSIVGANAVGAPSEQSRAVAGLRGSLAFAAGSPMGLVAKPRVCRSPALRMSDDRSGIERRAALFSLAFLGLGSILPSKSMAQQSAAEAEEYARLLKKAQAIQEIFDSQKAANEGIPGLKPQPAAVAVTSVASSSAAPEAVPSPKQSPEDVAKVIFTALKVNDNPSPNHGLKVTLGFSSPENPVLTQPFEVFASQMQNGAYSVLLGKFDSFAVKKVEERKEDGSDVALVDATVTAPYKTFLIQGMKMQYLVNGEGDSSKVTFRLMFRRNEATKNCWLFDTLYLVDPSA